MHVRFWGTRGSLPKPGPDTLRYGGNTSCIEVQTVAGTLVIIDCGSGLHGLGQTLWRPAHGPILKGHILISHTHWDHIQGIPFFTPFFVPETNGTSTLLRGLGNLCRRRSLDRCNMPTSPSALDQMGAKIRFHELIEGRFPKSARHHGQNAVPEPYRTYTRLPIGGRRRCISVRLRSRALLAQSCFGRRGDTGAGSPAL